MEDHTGQSTFHPSTKRSSNQSRTSEELLYSRQHTSSLSPNKGHRNPSGDFVHLSKQWYNRTFGKRTQERSELEAKENFRKAVKKTICLLKVCNAFTSLLGDGRLPKNTGSFHYVLNITDPKATEVHEQDENQEANPLKPLFDPAWFRANREIRLGSETKAILCQEPETRTPEQLQTVFRYLYTLPAFAEYPLYHQKSICQDGTYQSFPANVTIVKQGDRADNFYFVLSGSATVISREESFVGCDTDSVSVVKRGMAFGESAIMSNSLRKVTVVSKTPIELLVVTKEDYNRIFFGTNAESGKKEYLSFLRTIDFLRDWPIDTLNHNPEKSQHCYFRRGTVIVKNSNDSEWIYVVKSGVCEVLTRLRAVKPRRAIGKEVQQLSCLEQLTKLTLEQRLQCKKWGNKNLSRNLQNLKPQSKLIRPIKRLNGVSETCTTNNGRPGQSGFMYNNKLNCITEENYRSDLRRNSRRKSTSTDSTFSEAMNVSKSLNKAAFSWKELQPESRNDDSSIFHRRKMRSFSLPSTISADILKFRRQATPEFVRIDLLHSKNVFGLSELDFEYNTLHSGRPASVSLVSRGAECIMISKKFFMEHAKANTKAWIRLNVQPFLSMEKHQQTLQDKVDWESFKKKIVDSIVSF